MTGGASPIPPVVSPLIHWLPWLALGVVGLALLTLVVLVLLVRRASAPPPAMEIAPPPGPAAEKTRPASAPFQAGSLRQSFTVTMRLLKQTFSGRQPRYAVPWLLVLGDAGAGKSRALAGARLAGGGGPTLDGPHVAGSGCDWWFFEHGLAIDPTGGLLDGEDGDERGWRHLLHLLQRHRPRLPLDGILVVLSAADLLAVAGGMGSARGRQAEERLIARARLWNRRLWQAQKTLGLNLPVSLLVTKCDEVQGFRAFWEQMPPHRRQEIFGWSSPYAPETVFSGTWVGEVFATLAQSLHDAQMELAADPQAKARHPGDDDGMVLFPAAFRRLEEPLRIYLDHLLPASVYYEPVPLRGLYFSGLAGEGEILAAGDGNPVLLGDLFARKLFAERGLAIPLANQLVSRNRRVQAVQGLLAATVAVLSVGLTLSVLRLGDTVDSLQPVLRQVAEGIEAIRQKEHRARETAQAMSSDISFFRQDDAVRLLDLMAQIRATSLQPLFMPTSLFSGADRRLRSFLTEAFDSVILRAMHNQLELRTRKVLEAADKAPPAAGQGALLQLEKSGEFARLQNFIQDLRHIEKLADRYNNLGDSQDVGDMATLTRDLFNVDLPPSYAAHKDLFRDILGDVQNQVFDPAAYRSKATARARGLIWQLYNHLFQSGPISQQLRELTVQLRALDTPPADLDGEASQLRQASDALDATQAMLTNPEVRWLARDRFDLGDAFRQNLGEISVSGFFDRGLAEELGTIGQAEFERFQSQLGAYTAPLVGPVLAQKSGRIQAALAPAADALGKALAPLSQQGFMQVAPSQTITRHFSLDRRLVWNSDRLADALRYYADYDHFLAEQLESFPPALRDRVRRLATARLQANMVNAVARAQQMEPLPGGNFSGTEVSVGADARNFRAVAPQIEQILTIFRQLDMGEALAALQDFTVDYAEYLLMRTDLLLETDGLYLPARPVAEWTGSPGLSLFAYQVADAAEMQRYLDGERERLQHLFHDYAEPLVGFLAGRPTSRLPEDRAVLARWQRIYEELGKYNNRRPDNALSTLERFLRSDMAAVGLDKCGELAPFARHTLPSGDFFEQRMISLRQQTASRCQTLLGDGFAGRYRGLVARFDDSLAGRYPFAAAQGNGEGEEADPDAVRGFFRDGGADLAALSERMGELAEGDPARRPAAVFLRQLAQDSAFFKALDGGDAGLEARLNVAFRVNREQERGGNQIIEWVLQIGQTRLTPADTVRAALWRPGDPIVLSLRWAKDAPVRPLEVRPAEGRFPDQSPASSSLAANPRVDDLTARFALGGNWALFRLLDGYLAPGAAPSRTGTPQPLLLRFRIPVSGDSEPAQVFLRLGVEAVDAAQPGKGGHLLAVPAFPPRRPEFLPSSAALPAAAAPLLSTTPAAAPLSLTASPAGGTAPSGEAAPSGAKP